jgi:L-rhamnose isomerase
MRPICCIEHSDKAMHITAFVGNQIGVCEVFDFAVPEGYSPEYVSKQTSIHKSGSTPSRKRQSRRIISRIV